MTAHRRAWTLRASLVAVMVAGGLFGVASPALAAPPGSGLTVTAGDASLQVGGGIKTFTVSVTNSNAEAQPDVSVTITIPLSEFQVAAAAAPSGCTLNGPNEVNCAIASLGAAGSGTNTWTKVVQVKPPAKASINPGETKTGKGQVVLGNGPSASFNLSLAGAPKEAPTFVTQVTGSVKDVATGAAIPGATVTLQDSAGHNFSTTSSSSGGFSFRSTQSNPIAPGTLAIGAQKTGYKGVPASATVQAGQSYSFPALQLESTAAVLPTTIDSAPVVAPPDDTVSVAPINPAADEGTDGGSGFSTVLIVAGALLVLLGIGAIVLIMMRRRRDDGDDDGDDPSPPRRGPMPAPSARGHYRGAPDSTQAARAGGYADPTMVGNRAPSLGDAPTTVQPAIPVDEYPDPYGAPLPRTPAPTYGGGYEAGHYGGGPAGGYDERGGGEYGGNYRQPEEPTRGYETGGYERAAPGSGSDGYGGGNYGGGHDSPAPRGGGYDSPAPRGGDYDSPAPRGGGTTPRLHAAADTTRPLHAAGIRLPASAGRPVRLAGSTRRGIRLPGSTRRLRPPSSTRRGVRLPAPRGGYDAGGYEPGHQPRGGAYDDSRPGYPPADEYDQPRSGY